MRIARLTLAASAAVGLALIGGTAKATTLENTNLVSLLRHSTSIVTGNVVNVTDGFDEHGLPYTEVTINIQETLRGSEEGEYSFRQFGLLNERLSEDGTKKMLPAPEVFPRYAEGERVMLFLYQEASLTGLRAPTGLLQGKFTLDAGRAENGLANEGLFDHVALDEGLATDNDQRMLDTAIGAVSADTFTSFVRRAVENAWVERCQMWDSVEGKTCRQAPAPRRPTPRQTMPSGPTVPVAPKMHQ